MKYYVWWYEKIVLPRFLLLAHVYFTDQKNTDQKYWKTVFSVYMTIYFPDNSYFRVTMKLLMALLQNTDFLKASSVKVQDNMLTSGYISWNYADPQHTFLINPYNLLKKSMSLCAKTCRTRYNQDNWYEYAIRKYCNAKLNNPLNKVAWW